MKRALARFSDVVQRAHRFLDRRIFVRPVLKVEIHIVEAERLQAGVDVLHERRVPSVHWAFAIRPRRYAAFGDQDRFLASAPQRTAEQRLRLSRAVPQSGIEQGDTQVERSLNGVHELPLVEATIRAANLPGANADGGYL